MKDNGDGMPAVGVYREVVANAAKPGYYASARLELAYFGLGDALRGQRHYGEAAEAYEKTAFTPGASPELKIRTLLAAGQCHDVLHERDQAKRDYQMAIDTGPNTSRADAARKYLKNPYQGS
jgi:TolA-binding protein